MGNKSALLAACLIALMPGCRREPTIVDSVVAGSEWRLTVASPVDEEIPGVIWTGLTNPTDEAAVICLTSIEVNVLGESGNVSSGSEASPHARCDGDRVVLVMGQQSHFFSFEVSRNPIAPGQMFRVSVAFSEHSALSDRAPNELTLKWEGTTEKSRSSTRSLVPRAK